MSHSNIIQRLLMPVVFVTAIAGCEATFMSAENDTENNQQEGSIIENPFMQDGEMMHDKPNKSELEVAAMPQEEGGFDMAENYMSEGMMEPEQSMMMQPPKGRAVTPMIRVPGNSYQPGYTHKLLNDYAEQMAMDLMARAKNLDIESKIGIASFVDLTRNLQTTTVLGNQLSESFMNEIQAYGLSVIDFKTLDEIYVGQGGDLIFDRSGPRGDMQYVLSGTLQRSGRGVQVNARIIHLADNVVVSSTKGFIPHFVVSSLTPDYVLMQ